MLPRWLGANKVVGNRSREDGSSGTGSRAACEWFEYPVVLAIASTTSEKRGHPVRRTRRSWLGSTPTPTRSEKATDHNLVLVIAISRV